MVNQNNSPWCDNCVEIRTSLGVGRQESSLFWVEGKPLQSIFAFLNSSSSFSRKQGEILYASHKKHWLYLTQICELIMLWKCSLAVSHVTRIHALKIVPMFGTPDSPPFVFQRKHSMAVAGCVLVSTPFIGCGGMHSRVYSVQPRPTRSPGHLDATHWGSFLDVVSWSWLFPPSLGMDPQTREQIETPGNSLLLPEPWKQALHLNHLFSLEPHPVSAPCLTQQWTDAGDQEGETKPTAHYQVAAKLSLFWRHILSLLFTIGYLS